MQKTTLNVPAMCCADEVNAVERALRPLAGVLRIDVSLVLGTVTVEHESIATEKLIDALDQVGLPATEKTSNTSRTDSTHSSIDTNGFFETQRGHLVAVVLSGALTGLGIALEGLAPNSPPWLLASVFCTAIVSGAWYVAPKACRSAVQLRLDMNMLMTVAVIGAAGIGEWSEGATVAFLFALSELLESYSVSRARRAIRALVDIAPPTALVQDASGQREVLVDDVAIDSIVIVKSGMKIPLDGVVTNGDSTVNQAPITGESAPVSKTLGDTVYAGTINEDGFLEIRVTSIASQSTLARIVQLVGSAQEQKAPSERFVDTFAKYYTPAVFLIALGVLIIPPLVFGAPWNEWMYRGLVLLVIACPCALVISTPVSIVSGLTAMARRGVLVKGGAHLEEVGRMQVLAVDKTGTITSGKPSVQSVTAWGANDDATVLGIAAAVDAYSEHPLARAIVAHATEKSVAIPSSSGYKAVAGKGAEANINGKRYFVSNHRYAHDLGVCTPELEAQLSMIEAQGLSVVIVGNLASGMVLSTQTNSSGDVVGVIAIGDVVRDDARSTVSALRSAGVKKVIMLSGDNQRTVDAIAKQAGIDEAYGDLLPEDKVERVRELVSRYGHVGMVGDGVNDAPAMALASVGIAMGGIGTDAAIETADIALVQDELRRIPEVISLGKRTERIIMVNIGFALGLKAIFLVLAVVGITSLWLAILADTGATLLVVANALRLLSAPTVRGN